MGRALELLRDADLASLDLSTLNENTAQLFRQAMIIKSLNNKERAIKLTQLLPKEYDFLKSSTETFSVAALSEIFRLLSASARDIIKTNAGLAWAEIIIVDCISRADWLSASELVSIISNNPPPLKTTHQAKKSEEVNNTSQHNQQIDLASFRKFVDIAEQKSKTLAAKLGYAKIDIFNKNIIQFSESQENQTYLSFNEKDLALFWECINEIHFQNAEFKGKYTPKPLIKINALQTKEKSSDLTQNNLQKKQPAYSKQHNVIQKM